MESHDTCINVTRGTVQSGHDWSGGAQGVLAPVRTIAAPQQLTAAPATAQANGLWGALGSVMKVARPSIAPPQRSPARSLQLVSTRDGGELRLYVLAEAALECWQVRPGIRNMD